MHGHSVENFNAKVQRKKHFYAKVHNDKKILLQYLTLSIYLIIYIYINKEDIEVRK